MAKKKTGGDAKKANLPVAKDAKKGKLSAEERKAKAEARKAKLAALPEGQRANSRTIDIIEGENGSKVEVYAQPVRKFGLLITSVAFNADGEVVGCSTTTLAGYRAKSKKGHGNIALGAPGMGKKGKEDSDDDDDDDTEEEAEEAPVAKTSKKSKKKPVEDEDED